MSFHNVLVPEIARQHKETGSSYKTIQDTVTLYAMLIWPAGAVITLVSPEIILTLFGEQWITASEITPFFLVYSLAASPIVLASSGLVALGHGGALVFNQLAEQMSRVSMLFLAFFLDVYWVAALMIVPAIVYAAVAISQLNRFNLISPAQFGKALLRPLRITLISIMPALSFRITEMSGVYLSLEKLIMISILSAIVFLAAMKVWEEKVLYRFLEIAGVKK